MKTGSAPAGRKPAGLVLAAGYSSRMNAVKAMYPVGDELVVWRAVRILSEAGIDDIFIVTGHKKHLIETAVAGVADTYGSRIVTVENPDYNRGMFSSVLTGVKALAGTAAGFLLLPVDYPFVRSETVGALARKFETTGADIISPFCGGRKGHPPTVRNTVFSSILDYENGGSAPAGGLASILEDPRYSTGMLKTDDCGILDDVDDDGAYIRLLKKYTGTGPEYPSGAGLDSLIEAENPGSRIILHMEKTAAFAVDLAEKLNARGCRLNPGLLYSAAMLHDVCRAEPDHARAGADYLSRSGFPLVGEIIGRHMNIDHNEKDVLDEAAVLYLADKMMEEDRLADLSVRMESKLEKLAGNQAALENIRSRFGKAFMIKGKVEKILGSAI